MSGAQFCSFSSFSIFTAAVQLSSAQLSSAQQLVLSFSANEAKRTKPDSQAGRQAGQHCKLGLNYLLATELALLVITSTALNGTVLYCKTIINGFV